MPTPIAPVELGRTRELTRAEWLVIAQSRRVGSWLAAVLGTVFLAFAAVAAYGAYASRADHSVPTLVPVGLVVVFAVPGALFWNAAYLAAAERPRGRARRVGRLRGVVGVDGRLARTTVGGIGVTLPGAWAGVLPLGTLVDLEVTPPVDPADSWLTRNAARGVVSAHDGRLWIGDPASGVATTDAERVPR